MLRSPAARRAEHDGVVDRALDFARVVPAMLRLRRFLDRAARFGEEELVGLDVASFLDDGDFGAWVRSLLMYAYSTPYEQASHLSAALAVPMLREFLRPNRWTCIPGGVSTYVDRVAAELGPRVRVGAGVRKVTRHGAGVSLALDGGTEAFDVVVLAVPPHRVLPLLDAPSALEERFFGAFRGGEITTLVHTDTGPYRRRGAHVPSEFDLFVRQDGGHGYNAYLNRLAGLPTEHPPHYSLAFQMETEIAPTDVLHRQTHDVATYSMEALCHRAELVRAQGERSTYYAGAYLGDGLHEGAVRSGFAVGAWLGGRVV